MWVELFPYDEVRKEYLKTCRKCKIYKFNYRSKIRIIVLNQEMDMIRSNCLLNFQSLYIKYNNNQNRLLNLPTDILKLILGFVYGFDDNPVYANQVKCECGVIVSKTNLRKHQRTKKHLLKLT